MGTIVMNSKKRKYIAVVQCGIKNLGPSKACAWLEQTRTYVERELSNDMKVLVFPDRSSERVTIDIVRPVPISKEKAEEIVRKVAIAQESLNHPDDEKKGWIAKALSSSGIPDAGPM